MEHWRRKGVKCAPRDTSLSVNYCHMSPSLTFILPCVCICLTGKGKGKGVGSWGDSIYQIQIRIFFFLQRTTKQSCWKRKHMVADFGTKRFCVRRQENAILIRSWMVSPCCTDQEILRLFVCGLLLGCPSWFLQGPPGRPCGELFVAVKLHLADCWF